MKPPLDRPPFEWMNDISRRYLANGYIVGNQSGEARLGAMADTVARRLGKPELAEKIFTYSAYGWYSFSSPVWANLGMTRGLPISCFGTYVDDNYESLLDAAYEIGMMSKHGGGTSLCVTPVRPRDTPITDNGKSYGSVHHCMRYDTEIRVSNQGSTRRGECAVYWDIEHPDLPEAIKNIRSDLGADEGGLKKLLFGVTVTNDFMRRLIAGGEKERDRWALVAKRRKEKGIPYIIFIDNANDQAPPEYKKLGLRIHQSNLCTEIFLANGNTESFVCCLSSMNMYRYDEWKDTDAVEVLMYVLEAVMSEFIEKARSIKGFERAVRFAERQRALGMGQIGWHTYLQSRMTPFDAPVANGLAVETSKRIKAQCLAASQRMAAEYGEPEYLKGSGRRHMTFTAIAPTQSSAAICGQMSEGIMMLGANFVVKDKQKVKYVYKNPLLLKLLADKKQDTPDVIDSIFQKEGSVQHLDFLTPHEKAVFRTERETSPMAVIRQAAARQPYVCQGQSVNVLVDPTMSPKDINQMYVEAWKLGLKSLYYQFNVSAVRDLANNLPSCTACEG